MRLNYLENKRVVSIEANPIFDETTEVLVVGLGTAGAVAAISAAKQGAAVVGIERLSIMGGAATSCGVYDYFFGNDGGIFEEINSDCFDMMRHGYLSTDRFENKNSLPSYAKARALEKYAKKYGCTLFYETAVIGVYTEGSRVVGLQLFKDNRTVSISARVVIDSTGEGFVCRLAGCSFLPGRLSDNRLMIFSKPIGRIYDDYLVSIWRNYDFIDITDAQKYSKKVLESISQPVALIDWYDEKNKTIFESSHIGLRECFCVETEETYTVYDIMDGKPHKDCLFYAFAPLDNTNHDIAFENTANQDWMMLCAMPGYGFSVGVTRDMLIPKGFDGLMVASKGIGIGHDLSGLVRMKRDMEKCGETAGVIAALAVRSRLSPKAVKYEDIIAVTSKTHCYDEANNIGLCHLAEETRNSDGSFKKAVLPSTPEEIRALLSHEDFGTAMWKIRISDKSESIPLLKRFLAEDNERLKINCAFALGMLGDGTGADIIRTVIRQKPSMPKKQIHVRYYIDYAKALLLAGRLRDEEVTDELLKIVECDGAGYAEGLELGSYYRTEGDFENCFVSISAASLLHIAEVSGRSDEIISRLRAWCKTQKDCAPLEKTRITLENILNTRYADKA